LRSRPLDANLGSVGGSYDAELGNPVLVGLAVTGVHRYGLAYAIVGHAAAQCADAFPGDHEILLRRIVQETTVIVASADELRERARAAIREAFAERPALTAPQIIEHDDEGLKSGDS
jgi:hypothetical protein